MATVDGRGYSGQQKGTIVTFVIDSKPVSLIDSSCL